MTLSRSRPIYSRVAVTTPAAGNNFTRTNDSGNLWMVRSITFRLVTSAAVANRAVGLSVVAGEETWWRTVAGTVQVASLTRNYAAFNGSQLGADNATAILMAWPTDGLWIPAGHVIASTVALIDAGDQLSNVVMDVIEYPDALPFHLIPSTALYVENEQETDSGTPLLVGPYG